MNKHTIYLLLQHTFIGICICLSGCTPQPHIIRKKLTINPYDKTTNTAVDDTAQCPPLTIWIHGTNFLGNRLFNHVFDGKPGLKRAVDINKRYKGRMLANILNKQDPSRFPLDTFYIFCWSGHLNARLREKTACCLYAELKRVIADYEKTYTCKPRIQVIAHSHGGNVVLNLAKLKKPEDNITIDTVVLLACPVQNLTLSCIDSPMFNRIYSLYSNLDFVQVIAPQLIKDSSCTEGRSIAFPPFSNRHFPQRQHIKQIRVKINGCAIWHNDFVQAKFLKLLPAIINEADSWQATPEKVVPSAHHMIHSLSIQTIGKLSHFLATTNLA